MGTSDGSHGGHASGRSSRCIALVGPFLSGKTTLLEAILARTGGITRQGKIGERNTIGDATPEARDHGMSVGLNVADVSFLGDTFTFSTKGRSRFRVSMPPSSFPNAIRSEWRRFKSF